MTFLSPEIEVAYFASPLPLEGSLRNDLRYRDYLNTAAECYQKLRKSLSPEQLALCLDFASNLAEQHEIETMYAFQCGWLAARGQNE